MRIRNIFRTHTSSIISSSIEKTSKMPKTPDEWRQALASLPATPEKIPAFFFAHGQPYLEKIMGNSRSVPEFLGPNSPLANFLKDFGPLLLEKYKPKGIVVFSAHFESAPERLVTDYGDSQPLLFDFYGFSKPMYQLKFVSNGSSALSNRVVEAFQKAGLPARTTGRTEPRGRDGRGFLGPGLDHGVFVPFRLMFGDEFVDIPIVEVSMDSSMSPEKNWKIGKTVAKLREENILILSGGLTIHTFEDMSAYDIKIANPVYKEFEADVIVAAQQSDAENRKRMMVDLTKHRGFRKAHPREDHFVPIYVAAGAGEDGSTKVISSIHGSLTFAFGI